MKAARDFPADGPRLLFSVPKHCTGSGVTHRPRRFRPANRVRPTPVPGLNPFRKTGIGLVSVLTTASHSRGIPCRPFPRCAGASSPSRLQRRCSRFPPAQPPRHPRSSGSASSVSMARPCRWCCTTDRRPGTRLPWSTCRRWVPAKYRWCVSTTATGAPASNSTARRASSCSTAPSRTDDAGQGARAAVRVSSPAQLHSISPALAAELSAATKSSPAA